MPLRRSNHAQGTTMTSTDDLIHSLASTAGTRRGRVSLEAALAVTGAASLACALLLLFSVIGIRQAFAAMAVRMPFPFKVAYPAPLAARPSLLAPFTAT